MITTEFDRSRWSAFTREKSAENTESRRILPISDGGFPLKLARTERHETSEDLDWAAERVEDPHVDVTSDKVPILSGCLDRDSD